MKENKGVEAMDKLVIWTCAAATIGLWVLQGADPDTSWMAVAERCFTGFGFGWAISMTLGK